MSLPSLNGEQVCTLAQAEQAFATLQRENVTSFTITLALEPAAHAALLRRRVDDLDLDYSNTFHVSHDDDEDLDVDPATVAAIHASPNDRPTNGSYHQSEQLHPKSELPPPSPGGACHAPE